MYFVYRSHYEGPLSKRIRHLPDETVLSWFQRGWDCGDPDSWIEAELGGDVYGLHTIFDAAREHELPRPETTAALRSLLYDHLYVEGDEDYIRLDEHSLRVRTDDDEVGLAYFFFDEPAVAAAPGRLAYLLHEVWPLPDQAGPAGRTGQSSAFTAGVPVTALTPAETGGATTYAVLLTLYDGDSLVATQPLAFPGVDLTALAGHLRRVDVNGAWPPELLVLRALVAPGEASIQPALDRCNRWPGFNLNADPWPGLPDGHEAAHGEAMQMIADAQYANGRRPETSLLRVGDHLAQLAMHGNEPFGYQQWYLFDTVWAADQPELADSLLRYAGHWDPFDD